MSSIRPACAIVLTLILLFCASTASFAQQAPTPDATPTPAQMQEKLQKLSTDLAAAQERLQQSQKEIQRLQDELSAIQAQFPGTASAPTVATAPPPAPADTAEKVDILQAEVKTHEQIKVESASKYPVHVTGLVLFNTFVDSGNVDNIDLPTTAQPPTAGSAVRAPAPAFAKLFSACRPPARASSGRKALGR
jgi:hypothetical protein